VTSAHSRRTAAWMSADTAGRARSPISAGTRLRPLARRVHFLAGLLVAPFLLVLCLTGLAYVFSPQIHDDLYSAQLFVDQVGATRHPISNQVTAALTAHPEARVQSVVPPAAPDRTTRVNLQVPGLDDPLDSRTVFVDPYTNFISGELRTSDGRLPANVWLRELHSNMHLGEIGRLYSEVAASWLPVIAVGGLIVWISKLGRRRRSAAELLVPAPRGKGEMTRLRSVHGPLGIWLTVGLLVISVTGLLMSPLAGWGLPDVREPTLTAAPVEMVGLAPIGIDDVLTVAETEGLGGELKVTPPPTADRPFVVVETSKGLPVRKGAIAVDPYTAQVTERIGWNDYPVLAQLREIGVQLHTGTLFGLANQILLTLVVLGTIALIVGGYRMWWQRNPFRETTVPTPPPALAALSWPDKLGVAAAVVVLGWLLPAFGISFLLFLLLDLVIRAVRTRTGRARRAAAAGAALLVAALFAFALFPGLTSTAGQSVSAGAAPDPSGPDASAAGPEISPWLDGVPNGAFDFAPGVPGGSAIVPRSSQGAAAPKPRTTSGLPTAGAEKAAAADAVPAADDPGTDGVSGIASEAEGAGDPLPGADPGGADGAPGVTPTPPPPPAADPPVTDPPPAAPGLVANVVGILTGAVNSVTGLLGN